MVKPAVDEVFAPEPEVSASFSVRPQFWRRFCETYWDQRPVVFRNVFSAPLLTPDDLWQSIQVNVASLFGATARRGTDKSESPGVVIRTYIGDGMVEDERQGGFLPRGERSFEEYTRHLTSAVGSQFALVLNNPHVNDPLLAERCRRSFAGLIEAAKIPFAVLNPTIFIGNYPKTSFGVHKDAESVFTVSIAGRKTFLLWPPGYFAERGVPRVDGELGRIFAPMEPFLNDALRVVVNPGDLLYWPANAWHIGIHERREDDGVTATIGIGLSSSGARRWFQSSVGSFIAKVGADGATFGRPVPRPEADGGAVAMPEELSRAISLVEQAVAKGEFRRFVERTWMARLVGDGLPVEASPVPATASLSLDESVRRDLQISSFVFRSSDEVVVTTGDRSTAFPFSRAVEDLLTRVVCSTEPITAAALRHVLRDDGIEIAESAVLAVLEQLLASGMLLR